ncbi:hypothetical protein ACH4E7_31805 [Kitasatospora sp. NPDC018058]|uniref:hypothetical protein n=1 Tax=Kitasatospora sp. NPDC018058 TaxID=3364025 RepID=UPI0037C14440
MADGSGYAIQAGGVEGQAKALDKAADDQHKITAAAVDPVCYSADALGGEDVEPAYRDFNFAWKVQTGVIGSALRELAGKVRESSGNYGKAESAAVAGLREAASGGDYRPFG